MADINDIIEKDPESLKNLAQLLTGVAEAMTGVSDAVSTLSESLGGLEEAEAESNEATEESASTWAKFRAMLDKTKEKFAAIGEIMGTLKSKIGAAFSYIKGMITASTASSQAFFESLNNIVGINGKIGELGTALRNTAGGVVGKADLASFFGNTGNIIQGAEAMKQQAGYARDLIAAYGSVNVAVAKYQNIMQLSVEDQKTALETAKKMAEVVEKSSAGQLQAIKKQAQEAKDNFGQALLYAFKPFIEFLSYVAQAFKEISGVQFLDDQTAALEKNLELSEEERRVQEELAEMERLSASGFTSSLDEAHEVGGALVEATPEEEADQVSEAEEQKQEAMSKTMETAHKLAEAIYSIIGIVSSLRDTFIETFSELLPQILDAIAGFVKFAATILKAVSAIFSLKGALIILVSVLAAAKAAQIAYAIATAVAQVAKSGMAAPATAAAITAGAVAVTAGIALAVGTSTDSSTSSSMSSSYTGTANESGKSNVTVYLDAKKVSDGLANSDAYDAEVKIG